MLRHKGKVTLLAGLMIGATMHGQMPEVPKDFLDKVNGLYAAMGNSENMKAAADSLSPNDRATIIEYLNQQVKLAGHEPSEAENVLVNLGDDEAISREAQSFPQQSTGGGSFLVWAIQPKVVPALVPALFVNESSPYNDLGGPSKSFFSAEAIRELLERSPYFSANVNQWAASWKGKGGNPPFAFREMMRNWWNANRLNFENGTYAAVEPGPPPSTSPFPPVASLTPQASASPPPFPEVTPTGPVSTPAASPMPVPPKESSWLLISMIGVLALAVAGFIVFLKVRK